VDGTKAVVESARAINAKVVFISTDYVFDGLGQEPHFEEKETNPINYYGYTKEQGEKIVRELIDKHFIVRTSWVYGSNGSNFVKTMLRLAGTNNEISVVNDQIGSPTYTKDLTEFIIRLVQTNNYGTHHGVNDGYCSWYEFAKKIFEIVDKPVRVIPITSEQYITKAVRPKNSKMHKTNIDGFEKYALPSWEDALKRFLLNG
jgi:dTDP-4-dehydrorhamnose reductase/dTDP-4-dehydrorhamnose 3,5-epimerase